MQIAMTTEILQAMLMFGINMKSVYSVDNKEFLNKLVLEITAKLMTGMKKSGGKEEKIELSNEYIEAFDNPPLYKKTKNGFIPIDEDNFESNKPKFLTILQSIKMFMVTIGSKYKFESKLVGKMMTEHENVSIIPGMKMTMYLNKNTDEYGKRMDVKINIWVYNEKSKYPGTVIQKSKNEIVNCTYPLLYGLWEGSAGNIKGNRFGRHSGCIFLKYIALDCKYYKNGQPETTLTVDKMALNKLPTSSSSSYTAGSEFIKEDHDTSGVGEMIDRDEEEY
jgi:hypothetical protein